MGWRYAVVTVGPDVKQYLGLLGSQGGDYEERRSQGLGSLGSCQGQSWGLCAQSQGANLEGHMESRELWD